MDSRESLLERLLRLDADVAAALELARQLQASPRERMRTFGNNLHRHARGIQCTAAAVRQELSLTYR